MDYNHYKFNQTTMQDFEYYDINDCPEYWEDVNCQIDDFIISSMEEYEE